MNNINTYPANVEKRVTSSPFNPFKSHLQLFGIITNSPYSPQ